jgi:hypothetical protein
MTKEFRLASVMQKALLHRSRALSRFAGGRDDNRPQFMSAKKMPAAVGSLQPRRQRLAEKSVAHFNC